MEDDLSVQGPSTGIPIGGLSQVRDLPQVVHAVQVWKHLLGVAQEEREQVVDMTRALDYVGNDDVQVHGQVLCFHAVAPEVGEGLLLQVHCGGR